MNRSRPVLALTIAGAIAALGSAAAGHARRHAAGAPLACVSTATRICATTPPAVERLRRTLATFIWGPSGFPAGAQPERVTIDAAPAGTAGVSGSSRIDRLEIRMAYAIDSVELLFHAAKPNRRLVIWHEGHEATFPARPEVITFLLAHGYDVLAIAMPLKGGVNSTPIVNLPRWGRFRLVSHDQMQFLERPFRFFFTPVAAAVNYAERHGRYRSIDMAGLSGGGWTTAVYAALDPRISRSYPVAGSYPMNLRLQSLAMPGDGSLGDWEQYAPALYRIASYLDLYVMGADRPGRRELQIFNEFDPCCFAGRRYASYEPRVRAALQHLHGGRFDVYLDVGEREHRVAPAALDAIAASLGAGRAP